MFGLSDHQSRSLAIFIVYNTTCLLVAARCIQIINRESSRGRGPVQPPSSANGRMRIFGVAALLSITTTWYYMINFYAHSYRSWLAQHNPEHEDSPLVLLASWLRDTKLFKQAWSAVVETQTRQWWSQQIFGFCAGWSVFLGIHARQHGIRGLWWFMLLGQIVSISFASNLSFLAVLAARRGGSPAGTPAGARSGNVIIHAILIITAVCAAMVPFAHAQREFMPVLLVPHVLAFAPLIPALRPTSGTAYLTATGVAGLLLAQTTTQVVAQGASAADLLAVFHEHPAVSSVGWDVICCWVSYGLWYALEG